MNGNIVVENGLLAIGTATPTQSLSVSGTAHITGALHDSSGDAGTNGQVLSSTADGTDWIDFNAGGLIDADGDTQIQVEEGADDDTIRFDTAGVQRAVISANGNLGLRTNTPTETLDVNGTALFRRGGSNTQTSGNEQIVFSQGGGTVFRNAIKSRHFGAADTGNAIDFYTWNHGVDGSNDNPSLLGMSVTAGRVGIATLTPSYTLTVNGNAQITEGLYDSDRNHGVVGQYLSSIGPTGTKWSNPLSFINSTGIGTRSGNTLYWDNTVSRWVETDFLNHQFDLIPDGGKELEAQPTLVHEINSFLEEHGVAPSSDGNYLFVTVETSHNQFALQLVDVSNPAQPVEVGSPMNFPGVPSNAEQYTYSVVNNNHLYIIGFQRILVYDVSTPTAPSLIQNLPATGGASFSARFYENHLYVTRILADRIDIYDASTPGSLSFVHTINAPNNNDVFDLEIVDDILYVGVSDEELSIYNVSTPTAPVLLQTINLPFNRWRALKLIAGQYLYAATHSELTVFNVLDPTNPVAISSLNAGLGEVPGSFNPLENCMILLRNSLIFADQFDNILHYIDVSNPAVPKYKYTVSLGGTGDRRISAIVQTGTSTYTYAIEVGNNRGLYTVGNEFTDGFQSSRVGIGTTSPDQTLSVNGNASKSGGGTWATFSDRRVKKNIRQYEKGLDEILQIKPVIFNYNDKSGYSNTQKDYVGVIAQDIEGVLPSTITRYDDSNGPSGLSDKRQFDSSEVLWALVNAVKELQAQNEALKARIKQLEK